MGYDTTSFSVLHYDSMMIEFKSQPISEGCILFLGNSITEGGDWPKLLQNLNVINHGIGGDLTFGVLRRLNEVARHKPKQVFLMIGINDLSRNVPDSLIVKNIFSIVEGLHQQLPETKIIVQSLLPVDEAVNDLLIEYKLNPSVSAINQALKENTTEYDYVYLDLHTYFSNDSGMLNAAYTYDGIHLNSKGYDKWVKVLKSEGLVN